jgi:hypothetical protein
VSGYSTPPERAPGARAARRARDRMPVLWIVLPLAILAVVAVAFTLRALL